MLNKKSALILVAGMSLLGCEEADEAGAGGGTPSQPYTDFFSALPTQPIYPEGNAYSEAKEHLGEMLFFDPILSANDSVACATCHHPEKGWGDNIPRSIGFDGVGLGEDRFGNDITDRNFPTILNVAFTGLPLGHNDEDFISGGYFWDLRADTLEDQALMPIVNKVEMRGHEDNLTDSEYLDVIVEKIRANHEYVYLFESAFPQASFDGYSVDGVVNKENLAKALATFQRKIISPQSRFDHFLNGDETALSSQEITGLNKFINGGCARCHSGPMLSDNLIHEGEQVVPGLPEVRTPMLRNISVTAPYMQDGSHATLRAAIAIYEDRSDLQVSIGYDDFSDIEAFLKTLDAEGFYSNVPESVPSGLPVGGDIQ